MSTRGDALRKYADAVRTQVDRWDNAAEWASPQKASHYRDLIYNMLQVLDRSAEELDFLDEQVNDAIRVAELQRELLQEHDDAV